MTSVACQLRVGEKDVDTANYSPKRILNGQVVKSARTRLGASVHLVLLVPAAFDASVRGAGISVGATSATSAVAAPAGRRPARAAALRRFPPVSTANPTGTTDYASDYANTFLAI